MQTRLSQAVLAKAKKPGLARPRAATRTRGRGKGALPLLKRLSQISCDKSEFQKAISMYEQALQASGHHQKLQFQQEHANQRKRTRKRNITWFNPPYNDLVSTNVGKRFFYLLEKHFPPLHRLHKIFNRNTIKLSYSCTTNMAGILSSHNKKILSEKRDKPDPFSFNCRKTPCPMSGRCREKSITRKPP